MRRGGSAIGSPCCLFGVARCGPALLKHLPREDAELQSHYLHSLSKISEFPAELFLFTDDVFGQEASNPKAKRSRASRRDETNDADVYILPCACVCDVCVVPQSTAIHSDPHTPPRTPTPPVHDRSACPSRQPHPRKPRTPPVRDRVACAPGTQPAVSGGQGE
ncbi:unnamed protein product [Boreogadus saida]